jgi:3D (Asp-Asp-Asp) domain-containing protein
VVLACAAAVLSVSLLGATQAHAPERPAAQAARANSDAAHFAKAKLIAIDSATDDVTAGKADPKADPFAAEDAAADVFAAQPAAYAIRHARPDAGELLHDATPAVPSDDRAERVETIEPNHARSVERRLEQGRRLRTMRMLVTAYCPCPKCCGPNAQGLTASGRRISYNGGRFVAADTNLLPFGTKLIIPGYHDDRPVQVQDRGGAIKGRHLDVFFPSHRQAMEWGKQWLTVTVVE